MDEFDHALMEALNEAVPPADFATDLAGRLAARTRRRARFWKLLLALGLFSAATGAVVTATVLSTGTTDVSPVDGGASRTPRPTTGTTGVSPVATTLRGEAISLTAESRREVAGTMLFDKRLHAADNLIHIVRLEIILHSNLLCRHVVLLAANVDFKVPARNVLFRLLR